MEVHGPCVVLGLSSTDCDYDVSAPIPITQYEYFGASAGANSLRLNKVHQLTNGFTWSCTSSAKLTTTYDAYDNQGNVGQVTDPNGVVTNYTYEEERVKTETV